MQSIPRLFTLRRSTNLIHSAILFAEQAHSSQRRKYTDAPYFTHCKNVAYTISLYTQDEEMIAAAYLHDTIEDTYATFDHILHIFGLRVATLVMEVTDVSTKKDGSRAVRKLIDKEHLAKSSPDGATIKLADIIDNTRDILSHDRKFAKLYLPEKLQCLAVLKHGNQELFEQAMAIVRGGCRQLDIKC